MFLTFPTLGQGYPTLTVKVFITHESLVPECNTCGQKMNEIYIVDGCIYSPEKIHTHFSHKHYEDNQDFREHYCIESSNHYSSAKGSNPS